MNSTIEISQETGSHSRRNNEELQCFNSTNASRDIANEHHFVNINDNNKGEYNGGNTSASNHANTKKHQRKCVKYLTTTLRMALIINLLMINIFVVQMFLRNHHTTTTKTDLSQVTQLQKPKTAQIYQTFDENKTSAADPPYNPEIHMLFDKACTEEKSNNDTLKWKHGKNEIGFKGGLEYDNGMFIIPKAAHYQIFVDLSIDTTYLENKTKDIGSYVCMNLNRQSRIHPVHCQRQRIQMQWAGNIEIFIPRFYFQKGDQLFVTLSSDIDYHDFVSLIRSNPTETMIDIFHVE